MSRRPPRPPRGPRARDFLRIGRGIRVLPIVHGSADCAVQVREALLDRPFECLAVPIPPSFRDAVEEGILELPRISIAVRRDAAPEEVADDDEIAGVPPGPQFSYVPIDPCQGVVAAVRLAMGERIPRAYVDRETPRFHSVGARYPDPHALKTVGLAAFAAALLPALPEPGPAEVQRRRRLAWMARELRRLEERYSEIAFVCALADWPWIKRAYDRDEPVEPPDESVDFLHPVRLHRVDPRTLLFALGELPFVTALHERRRLEFDDGDDRDLAIDGVKELLITARARLRERRPRRADRVTPQALAILTRYVRNLALVDSRLTPSFRDLVVGAKQVAGDDFALAVAETAREYDPFGTGADRDANANANAGLDPRASDSDPDFDAEPAGGAARFSVGVLEVPLWGVARAACRLPGPAVSWERIELRPAPDDRDARRWKQRWDPRGMCSWPPEDERIESFHRHVRDRAKALIGADLARVEKFTASVRDGIDLRETLRNWHTGDLYVKVNPPGRGSIEVVVVLFETPADPDKYSHRMTWYAEHPNESTLAFFSTDPMADLVGPGVARAEYGGAMFIYPPRPIPDVWTDPRLDSPDLRAPEARLLAAALLHSRERHVALVSPKPPPAAWRRLARRFGRRVVHLPLSRFGAATIERMRVVHVLNGHSVRSYAADFIRDD